MAIIYKTYKMPEKSLNTVYTESNVYMGDTNLIQSLNLGNKPINRWFTLYYNMRKPRLFSPKRENILYLYTDTQM